MSQGGLVTMGKKCFGKNCCWENVRRKCPVAVNCRLKAQAEKKKLQGVKR